METNLDSVLDRIRVLEQKIDEHPVQQVIVQSTGVGEGSAEQPKPAERPPQKAAPEDLQKIVAGWKMIVGQTTAAFKQALLQSVPKYNGETGEPILYVEFQTPLGRLYPDDSEAKKNCSPSLSRSLAKVSSFICWLRKTISRRTFRRLRWIRQYVTIFTWML